jgi:hypothetical protein
LFQPVGQSYSGGAAAQALNRAIPRSGKIEPEWPQWVFRGAQVRMGTETVPGSYLELMITDHPVGLHPVDFVDAILVLQGTDDRLFVVPSCYYRSRGGPARVGFGNAARAHGSWHIHSSIIPFIPYFGFLGREPRHPKKTKGMVHLLDRMNVRPGGKQGPPPSVSLDR